MKGERGTREQDILENEAGQGRGEEGADRAEEGKAVKTLD